MMIGCTHVGILCVDLSNCVPVPQKKTAESINSRLALVMKSGKANLGYKQTIKALRDGKGT